ncbi:hypothetical protein HMPREF0545_1556 [Ligilactobacillus salivarius DSM 20555 = ATCC 11741]|uniref:Uncharacterized protein n=1 Tax=Ligilactobacillus salivarius DSM 20555 = ATCC 11741 TaxID=1423799 RepID=C2EIT4_9LACO|nr:hypothetical protein HMPREF0545_1556 [Ligilactobacillus salivarius DSM 20555 = ATCC 11741]
MGSCQFGLLKVTNFIISCIELVNAIADLLEVLVKLRNIWHEFSSKRKNRR